jgi:hypothetical protein
MKRIVIMLTLVIALSIPASAAQACGNNRRSRHHHHFFNRHHVQQVVTVPVNDGSYQYYHDILGKSKAWYLINIKKLP